jgi:hypothetical protein
MEATYAQILKTLHRLTQEIKLLEERYDRGVREGDKETAR